MSTMVDVNGTNLYVEDSGTGMPLIFVHGTTGGTFLWERMLQFLSEYRCIRYDRRGNGKSGPDGDANAGINGDAYDLAALIKALGVAPCVLVGLSWGGAIIVDLLRRYPALCSSAVLGEPTIFNLDPSGANDIMNLLQPRIGGAMQTGGPRAAVDAFLSNVCGPFWHTLSDSERDLHRNNAKGMFRDLQAPPYAVAEIDLRAIHAPCLLLVGDQALPFHKAVGAVMREAIPNVHYVEIPQSGHVVFGEQPRACADAICTFLKREPSHTGKGIA